MMNQLVPVTRITLPTGPTAVYIFMSVMGFGGWQRHYYWEANGFDARSPGVTRSLENRDIGGGGQKGIEDWQVVGVECEWNVSDSIT